MQTCVGIPPLSKYRALLDDGIVGKWVKMDAPNLLSGSLLLSNSQASGWTTIPSNARRC